MTLENTSNLNKVNFRLLGHTIRSSLFNHRVAIATNTGLEMIISKRHRCMEESVFELSLDAGVYFDSLNNSLHSHTGPAVGHANSFALEGLKGSFYERIVIKKYKPQNLSFQYRIRSSSFVTHKASRFLDLESFVYPVEEDIIFHDPTV